jgi:hypothetical protein
MRSEEQNNEKSYAKRRAKITKFILLIKQLDFSPYTVGL